MCYLKLFFLIFLINVQVNANCKAILINGGGDPANNFNVHTAQLREMYNALRARGCSEKDIHVFSGSGSSTNAEFRVDPTDENSRYVANAYTFNGKTQVPNLYSADAVTLKSKIGKISAELKSDEKLFIYVADHGSNDNGKKGLVPWWTTKDYGKLFTPADLEQAISKAPATATIKLWTECCYCGVFNKIKRPNTCVATSTDEYHVGSYNWINWDKYATNQVAPTQLTSKTYFAGQIKNDAKVSLSTASRVSRSLTSQDQSIQAETLEKGCFIGPRDSIDQYMYEILGYGNKQMCTKDMLRLSNVNSKTASVYDNCDIKSPFSEIENLKKYIDTVQNDEGSLNFAEKKRMQELEDSLNKMSTDMKSMPEYSQIQNIKQKYLKLSNADKIKNAKAMQLQVAKLKERILKKTNYFETLATQQKSMVEALFYAHATTAQIQEFKKRKKCLDEPLF